MRPLAFLFVATMIQAGCAMTAPQASVAPQLAGTEWRFESVGGSPVPSSVHATLRFDDTGRASGNAGCNNYGASFHAGVGSALHFGEVFSTRMACLQPSGAMEFERGVLDALRSTDHVHMRDGDLTLLDANNTVLAALRPGK